MDTVHDVWKQPIPTNLADIFGEDYRCQLLYKELIYRACNKDSAIIRFQGVLTTIIRGQVIYGRNKYSDYLQWSPSTVDRTLLALKEKYHLVDMQRTYNYTIVTLLNYESLIKMNNRWTGDEQPMDTSKNIETVKTVNNRLVDGKAESMSYKDVTGLEQFRLMKQSKLGGKFEP